MLLPELLLYRGKRGDLGVEGGLQLVGLLGLLLGFARPPLGLALLGLRLPEPRAELPVLGPDGPHLRLPVGRHGAHLLQGPLACCSASSRSMRVVQICSMAGGRAAACPSCSKSWSRRASARYDSQPSWVLRASARASRASRCPRSWRSSALIWSKAPYLSRARCSSSYRQQTEANECCAARNKHGNDKIEERGNNALPRKRATPGCCGSAAPRSALG
jgi:hypothetical protein